MLAGSISGSNGEMYIDLIKLVFAVVFGSASVFGLGFAIMSARDSAGLLTNFCCFCCGPKACGDDGGVN